MRFIHLLELNQFHNIVLYMCIRITPCDYNKYYYNNHYIMHCSTSSDMEYLLTKIDNVLLLYNYITIASTV